MRKTPLLRPPGNCSGPRPRKGHARRSHGLDQTAVFAQSLICAECMHCISTQGQHKKAKTHALTCIIQALPGRLTPDKETNGAANQENHKTIKFNYSPASATAKRGLAEYNPLMVLRRPHFLILPHYNHQGLSKFKEHDKWRS